MLTHCGGILIDPCEKDEGVPGANSCADIIYQTGYSFTFIELAHGFPNHNQLTFWALNSTGNEYCKWSLDPGLWTPSTKKNIPILKKSSDTLPIQNK